MKIEKISNNQIKVLLVGKDLEERNIKPEELAYGTERAKELFREMIEEAVREFGFVADNIPLMIEAMHLSSDEVVLLVSKVDKDEIPMEAYPSMVPGALKERLFVRKRVEDMPEEISFGDSALALYSFETLDDVTRLSVQLNNIYDGSSTLYKEDGVYYLAIANDCADNMSAENFETLLSEFGTKHISNAVARAYLEEHAEVIIADKAVNILANL